LKISRITRTCGVFIASALLCVSAGTGFATTGIFESYIDLNAQFYDMQAATANPDYQGFNLGTFSANGTLTFTGGEIKTFKNGTSNVTGAELDYRIYLQSTTPPGFSTFNLPFNADLGGGDQSWRTTGSSLNVIPTGTTSRAAGVYNFEVFGKAFTNEGDRFSNNGGANYIATFIIQATDYVWNGGAGTGATGTPTNWVGGIAPGEGHNLHFAGSTQTTITNSFTKLNAIFFDSGASTFTVGGTAITLGNPAGQGGTTVVGNAAVRGIANNSSNNQNVNLNITLGNDATFNANTSTLTLGGSTLDLNGHRLTVIGSSNTTINNVISGVTTGTGINDFLKQGTGTVIFAGINTYSGETFVDSGTVQFGTTASATGSSDNSTIRLGLATGTGLNASINLATTAGGQTISSTINPRAGATGTYTLSLNSQNTSGTNTYSGHIGMDRDFLITQSAGGQLSITQARAGGVGTITGTDIKGFTLSLQPAATGLINITGDIYNSTGSGIVAISGGGTVTLSGVANTYTGGTTITGSSTLAIGNNTALGSGALTFSGSGNVQASGGARTIANNVSLSGGSATFTGTNDLTINGTITGANGSNRAFNNTATGVTLTLAGNIFITSNQANSQTLTLGNTAASGSAGTTTLVTGGIANNSGTNTVASNLAIGGGATVVLAGANTYTGTTAVSNAGTVLKIGNGGTTGNLGSGDVTVTTGNLSFNRSNAMTVANNISGTGSVSQIGGGTTSLTGTNSYGGATTVSNGTLLVNGNNSTAAGAVSVNNAGTILGGTGTIGGPVTVNASAKLQGGNGTTGTTLTLAGALTLSDNSIVQLALGSSGTHSTLARTGAGTWTFDSNQAFNFIDAGAQTTTYDNIITGLASDPGSEAGWIIVNPGWAGTFTYDGANIDLTMTAVPEPSTWVAGALAFIGLFATQRKRLARIIEAENRRRNFPDNL
jgi:fibronectin-binding autotransporter adhesin